MEPIATSRISRFYSYERLLAFGFGLLAVVSPLYIDRRPVVCPEQQLIDLSSWVPLLPFLLILASRFYSYERLLAFGFGLLAVVSPLYIDRRPVVCPEQQLIDLSSWVPLMPFVLTLVTALSLYFDRGFTRLDPYWIHRVGGSSSGIMVILVILALVIKWKASYWEG